MSQFGSLKENVDYEIESNTLMFNVNYLPTKNLDLSLTASYTKSTAKMGTIGSSSDTLLAHSCDFDISGVDEYSKLDITQMAVSLDADYKLSKEWTVGIGLGYEKYEDNDPYLEDGSGDNYSVVAGLTYHF